jgi:DNA-binding winged helix-turn-helix (wHTH) protein/Tfp pilus assembly protein PilF
MPHLDGPVFCFGNYILAPRERLLLRDREPVGLSGKAFDVLSLLVRRAGHLVSKGELLSEVWPRTLVQEVNLTVHIASIRKALQDGEGDGPFIATVARHGYRFMAPVRSGVLSDGGLTDADRAYLKGRHAWAQRSERSLKDAIGHFETALELQPELAAAHAGLSDCHATLGSLSHVSPERAFPAARRHALQAIKFDRSLAEAHASLGFVRMYFDWDWAGAEAAFRQAIELDPDHAASHDSYSTYLLAMGRAEEALREIGTARRREPLSPAINTDLGFHYYYTGRYEEAVKQLEFVLDLDADFAPARLWLGRAYQEMGQFERSLSEYRKAEQALGNWPVLLAARGFVAARSGRIDEAQATLAALQALQQTRFVTSYGLGLIYAGLGEHDTAFAALQAAFEERSNWLVWLRLDPRWSGLRRDSRFAEMVTRLAYPGRANRGFEA